MQFAALDNLKIIPYKTITKYIVVHDLILELIYESGNFSMSESVPNRPQVYIANLHHGHSPTNNYWGNRIKTKKLPESEKGLGIKLLAWSVINIDKIFPELEYPPELWCGNFNPGFRYWINNKTFWSKLTNETYMDNEVIIQWANDELNEDTSNKISKVVKIYYNDLFLNGGKCKKSKKSKIKSKRKKSRKN